MHRASHERSINRKQIEHDFFFKLKDLRTLLLNFNLRQVVFQNSCIVFCFDQFKSAEPYILKLSQ